MLGCCCGHIQLCSFFSSFGDTFEVVVVLMRSFLVVLQAISSELRDFRGPLGG